MSSKYKRPAPPRDPATLKVTRGDIINFMNFMSMDENFCLRVWNTVQNAHAKYKAAEEEAALRANAEERAAERAKVTDDEKLAVRAERMSGAEFEGPGEVTLV